MEICQLNEAVTSDPEDDLPFNALVNDLKNKNLFEFTDNENPNGKKICSKA